MRDYGRLLEIGATDGRTVAALHCVTSPGPKQLCRQSQLPKFINMAWQSWLSDERGFTTIYDYSFCSVNKLNFEL